MEEKVNVDRMKAENGGKFSLNAGQFYINTIEELDHKIASLSVSLDEFSEDKLEGQLVVESHPDGFVFLDNDADGAYQHEDNDDEIKFGFGPLEDDISDELKTKKKIPSLNSKELDQFAGVYSCKVVLSQSTEPASNKTSIRSFKKKIQGKIGMSESHQSLAKRPMLVELHSFPGFDKDGITPLPFPLEAIDVLKIVTAAQTDLERKPTFKRDFTRFFHSRLSQAILQDTFWWFFCQKYQPVVKSQQSLFNRVAHNYTKQLNRWIGSRYQDTIFQKYPDLLSQAIYATFCHAFPTSYRQFDDKFKDDLIFVIYQWVVGTRPAPRTYAKWNLRSLEPSDMRRGEQLHVDSASKTANQGFEQQLNEDTLDLKHASSQRLGPSHVNSQSHVANPKTSVATKKTNVLLPSINVNSKRDVTSKHNYNNSDVKVVSGTEAEKESRLVNDSVSAYQLSTAKHVSPKRPVKESCTAGKGPEFSKSVFDIYGRSPLVEQFLLANRLSKDSGTATLVRRTEISELPSASAPTYQDVIKQSLSYARKSEKKYRCTLEENAVERTKFHMKQNAIQKDLTRKTAELMANPKEIKRLSKILRIQLLSDPNDE